jgi:hypothetical protein
MLEAYPYGIYESTLCEIPCTCDVLYNNYLIRVGLKKYVSAQYETLEKYVIGIRNHSRTRAP